MPYWPTLFLPGVDPNQWDPTTDSIRTDVHLETPNGENSEEQDADIPLNDATIAESKPDQDFDSDQEIRSDVDGRDTFANAEDIDVSEALTSRLNDDILNEFSDKLSVPTMSRASRC